MYHNVQHFFCNLFIFKDTIKKKHMTCIYNFTPLIYINKHFGNTTLKFQTPRTVSYDNQQSEKKIYIVTRKLL